jgi:hypothetical protein
MLVQIVSYQILVLKKLLVLIRPQLVVFLYLLIFIQGNQRSSIPGKSFFLISTPQLTLASGKFIVVKNIDDPSDCFIYRGHTQPTTVAKFSPNGYWVASAGPLQFPVFPSPKLTPP